MAEQYDPKLISMIRHLFKCREDVFAVHWAKGKKSGYSPAYHYDPYRYRMHKMKGGSFQNFEEKSFLLLTDQEIQKHLTGQQLIGIYPLFPDNTSWFIAADFDKTNWQEESLKFLETCKDNGIPAYLERSRSGHGGHVWVFFAQPYPSIKSRKIFKSLLEKAGLVSMFEKTSSFDRLFPNQDFLSGKGLGNLIALPFHKPAVEQGNSCFVNPSTPELIAVEDQQRFLQNIQRVETSQLDQLYDSFVSRPHSTPFSNDSTTGKLQVVLSNDLRLNRSGLTSQLINFLKEELSFANQEFFIQKKANRSTWQTPAYFSFIEEAENEVIIPRGLVGKLLRYCKEKGIDFKFIDKRERRPSVDFAADISLRPHQEPAFAISSRKDFGIISAPPGSGKTVIGLKIIADKDQPALILVHRKQLFQQWMDNIHSFLKIPLSEIGKVGQGKTKTGSRITVAMIQSLGKFLDKPAGQTFAKGIGTVIIDECHHIGAETYRAALSRLAPYYQYGLTATPFRKGNETKILFIQLGDLIAEINPQQIGSSQVPRIIIRQTDFDVPFDSKTDNFETLSKILVHDSARNRLILKDVTTELNLGKRVVILTERKEHIETLNHFLKQGYETITLSGEDTTSSRELKWKLLKDGQFQVLITTGQYFGEGSDLTNVSTLFLAYPFSFKGKLIQYIGRVQRSEATPTIYDYRDFRIPYLNRLFLKRNTYYRQLEKQASLFDDKETTGLPGSVIIEKEVKIPMEKLDFRYGAIGFDYEVKELSFNLELEVENHAIRPEFDVLKPYFAKTLRSKTIQAAIYAEFENGFLVSQSATSSALEKINREMVDSMKFQLINKKIFNKQPFAKSDKSLLNLADLNQTEGGDLLPDSENDLLEDILKYKNVKHKRQLRYLASRHEAMILKLRFMLEPFSFLFLLAGAKQYHLVLETLDTEEATYVWHYDKNRESLPSFLASIEKELHIIRNKGRHAYLETQPENFSRILHDYSDERKGFVVWRDSLEEKIN